MGILPMSPRGVSPLESAGITGKMPVRLMGETPMLRRTAFFNELLVATLWKPMDYLT